MMSAQSGDRSNGSVPRVTSKAGAAGLTTALQASGAVIIENVLNRERLAVLAAELAPWFARAKAGEGPFLGRRTRRFSALFDRAPSTIDLALWPGLFEAIETYLAGAPPSPSCDCIQINLTQAVAIGPGEPAQALHRDATMFPVQVRHEMMINVMWAIDDFTEENGATRVIPGSHVWGADRRGQDAETHGATMPAGSALIWLGSTWHGGGENRTCIDRRGVIISYSLAWLAQAEKLLLSIPPEKVKGMPERLQRLIGYQVHRPNLGWVEGRDPIEWLHRNDDSPGGRPHDLPAHRDHMTSEMEARISAVLAQRAKPVLI